MKLKISDFCKMIDVIAPFDLAESFDNVGLIIDAGDKPVDKVMFSLDLTSKVAQEAVEKGVDLLITHHPVLFSPVKKISVNDPTQRAFITLLQNGISHIAAHTNWDSAENGVNYTICENLGLKNHSSLKPKESKKYKLSVFVPTDYSEAVHRAMISAGAGSVGNYAGCTFSSAGQGRFTPLLEADPSTGRVGIGEKVGEVKIETEVGEQILENVIKAMKKVHPYEEVAYDLFLQQKENLDASKGLMRAGELEDEIMFSEFIRLVKKSLNVDFIRKSNCEDILVKRVAVASGSGSSLLCDAAKAAAQVFLTSEIKHNHALEAMELGIGLVEIGHYDSEKPSMENLMSGLQAMINNIEYSAEFFLSEKEKNPLVLV